MNDKWKPKPKPASIKAWNIVLDNSRGTENKRGEVIRVRFQYADMKLSEANEKSSRLSRYNPSVVPHNNAVKYPTNGCEPGAE